MLNDNIGSDCIDFIAGEQLIQNKFVEQDPHDSAIADFSIQQSYICKLQLCPFVISCVVLVLACVL